MNYRLLVWLLIFSLTACPLVLADTPEYLNLESELPVVKEGEHVTLSVMLAREDAYGADAEKLWFWNWARDAMNVEFDIEQVLASAILERKKLMFAADDLKDVLYGVGLSASELVRYGQCDGQLLDFATYANETYMPNLTAFFERSPHARALSTTPDGGLYTLPEYMGIPIYGMRMMWINQEWLAETGMDMPQTLDEFTEMLKRMKENHPDGTPLSGAALDWGDTRFFVLNALGFLCGDADGLEPAIKDGEAVLPCAHPQFRAYLETVREYYELGLIAQDYFTMDGMQVDALMSERKTGASFLYPFLTLPDPADYENWYHSIPLTSEYSDTRAWIIGSDVGGMGQFAAAADTQYPEVVARFADFHYTVKGACYAWYGPAAHSGEELYDLTKGWYFKDGVYQALDIEDGAYASDWERNLNSINSTDPGLGMGSELTPLKALVGLEPLDERPESMEGLDLLTWLKWHLMDTVYPYTQTVVPFPSYVFYAEEDNTAMSDLLSVIKPYVKSEVAKFITGARDLSEFDAYISELETMGVRTLEGYYQAAYAGYLRNMGME